MSELPVLPPDQRWCVGYEGKYAAAYNGDIISYAKGKPMKLKGGVSYNKVRADFTYRMYCLTADVGVPKSEYGHRLVATAWIQNPEDKPTVNHIDHDKLNNCVENLEWASFSENTKASLVYHGDSIKQTAQANKGFSEDVDFINFIKTGDLRKYKTRQTIIDKTKSELFKEAGVPLEVLTLVNRAGSFLDNWNFIITYLDAIFEEDKSLSQLASLFYLSHTLPSHIKAGRRWKKEVEVYNKYRNDPEYMKNYYKIYKLDKIKLDKS